MATTTLSDLEKDRAIISLFITCRGKFFLLNIQSFLARRGFEEDQVDQITDRFQQLNKLGVVAKDDSRPIGRPYALTIPGLMKLFRDYNEKRFEQSL